MEYEIRRLQTTAEIEDCIRLQKEIWGLDQQGTMSPITLKALTQQTPPVGIVLGAYDKGRMIGMSIALGTLEPTVAYGHMLGLLDAYRDHALGTALMQHTENALSSRGITEMVWTFDPLESRNANVYINRMGARGYHYQEIATTRTAICTKDCPRTE